MGVGYYNILVGNSYFFRIGGNCTGSVLRLLLRVPAGMLAHIRIYTRKGSGRYVLVSIREPRTIRRPHGPLQPGEGIIRTADPGDGLVFSTLPSR